MKIGTKLVEAVSGLAKNVGDAFDKNFANKEEQLNAKGQILAQITDLKAIILEAQKYLVALEMQGNWLQRSWRPIIMLTFGFIIFYAYFFQPAFLPNQVAVRYDLVPDFWDLLKLGVGGYVGGRTLEKVVKLGSEAYKTRKERNKDLESDI